MNILYDTGYGFIEIQCELYLHRMDLSKFKDIKFVQLAVRTWGPDRKKDNLNRPIPAKNIRCILSINKAVDQIIKQIYPCILVISLDEPSKVLYKLDSRWVRLPFCAITKSDSLPEETYHNFLQEVFGYAV